ncbi:MAG: hypothetical protein JO125_00150 [Chloroflexi bacterium]|nr:hypothetical protein [Ktedonobacteraceae bacterium]MBV9019191.1 hypothetical protein [Ktedonobacteraceae bacterium]MBV9705802.1 hypothetical protein [Chloroflexota bacterium]
MGDGIASIITGLGGPGEKAYAKNIGVMAVTRVFSSIVFLIANEHLGVASTSSTNNRPKPNLARYLPKRNQYL